MTPVQIQQMYEDSKQALAHGGFADFYDTQLAYFKHYCPHFNYSAFRERLKRAVRPISSAEDLLAYNVCHSADHYARFEFLLDYVQNQTTPAITPPIRLCVFDYGCGQGLATLALLSHLKGREVELIIHLIEPSELALSTAEQYVSALADSMQGTITVHTHQAGLDQVPDHVFTLPEGFSAVHLFSNILDMAYQRFFDLSRLVAQLNQMTGKHICFAVSPTYISGKQGFDQLRSLFAPNRLLLDVDKWGVSVRGYRIYQNIVRHYHAEGRFLAFVRNVQRMACQGVA